MRKVLIGWLVIQCALVGCAGSSLSDQSSDPAVSQITPTSAPTLAPTAAPGVEPSPTPTVLSTPISTPITTPATTPSSSPSSTPTASPSSLPTAQPSGTPSPGPLNPSAMKVLHKTTAKTGWYTDTWANPTVSDGNARYFVYVAPDLRAMVGRIDANGLVTEKEIESGYAVTDDGHNEFTIGIDKDGFLHILGDMHNNSLRYWRSSQPRSIDSFEKKFGDIPDTSFTYYRFHIDQNSELYLSARVQTLDTYYERGGRGVGLFAYEASSKKWLTRGELPSKEDAVHPVVFWQNSGQNGGSYQMYKTDIMFDANNRMHMAFMVNTNDSENRHNYAVYAYSDDGGVSFQRADGTKLTLPMSIGDQAREPDVLAGYQNADLSEHASLFRDENNRPAVYFALDGDTYYRYLQKEDGQNTWSSNVLIRSGECERCRPFYNEQDRRFYFSDGPNLYYGTELGKPMQRLVLSIPIFRWDVQSAQYRGEFAGVQWSSRDGTWQLVSFN